MVDEAEMSPLRGAPLTKPRPIGAAHAARARHFKFRGDELNKGINQRNFKTPLKIDWVNSFIKLHCYLTKGFEGGHPLTKPRPIGLAHPKREISNFAGVSSPKELTKENLRTP